MNPSNKSKSRSEKLSNHKSRHKNCLNIDQAIRPIFKASHAIITGRDFASSCFIMPSPQNLRALLCLHTTVFINCSVMISFVRFSMRFNNIPCQKYGKSLMVKIPTPEAQIILFFYCILRTTA